MMNFNGYIDSANQFSGGLANASLTNFFMSESALEKRLEGLDEESRREVRKHLNEFHSAEEMEMFINQKTRGRERDQIS